MEIPTFQNLQPSDVWHFCLLLLLTAAARLLRSSRRWVKETETDQNQRKGKGKRGFWRSYKDDSWMKSVGSNLNSCSLFFHSSSHMFSNVSVFSLRRSSLLLSFLQRTWQFSRFSREIFSRHTVLKLDFTNTGILFTVWTHARSPAEPHGHVNNKAIQG